MVWHYQNTWTLQSPSLIVNLWQNIKYKSKPNTILAWLQRINPDSNKLAYLEITSLEKS